MFSIVACLFYNLLSTVMYFACCISPVLEVLINIITLLFTARLVAGEKLEPALNQFHLDCGQIEKNATNKKQMWVIIRCTAGEY